MPKPLEEMKIMTVSRDQTLAMTKPSFGDAQQRNIEYGKFVTGIYSITYSKKSLGLTEKKLSENVFVYPTNSHSQLNFIFDAWRLAKNICAKNQIDLVLTQDPFLTGLVGWWIKKKFHCQLLIHFHGDFWQNPLWRKEHWYHFFFNWLQIFLIKKADAIRVMSQGQKEKLIRSGIDEKIIRVIPTPIEVEKFENYDINLPPNQNLFTQLKTNAGELKFILMVGRQDLVKDFATLFKAMNLVYQNNPSVGLWLVGNYTSYQEVKNQGLILPPGNVQLTPPVSTNDLPAYYKVSYLTVLSSTSESFGKVLVEANACGKPVVSTATTGAKQIIQDGFNGFLVPIGDSQALAEKIIYLLEHPEKAKEMGENGRNLMKQNFDGKINTKRIVEFWHDIINNQL